MGQMGILKKKRKEKEKKKETVQFHRHFGEPFIMWIEAYRDNGLG